MSIYACLQQKFNQKLDDDVRIWTTKAKIPRQLQARLAAVSLLKAHFPKENEAL